MQLIDQDKRNPSSGGGLYARTSQALADQAERTTGAPPNRKFTDMVIRRMVHLRGPNVWTYRPVIEAVVDIGELEDFPHNPTP